MDWLIKPSGKTGREQRSKTKKEDHLGWIVDRIRERKWEREKIGQKKKKRVCWGLSESSPACIIITDLHLSSCFRLTFSSSFHPGFQDSRIPGCLVVDPESEVVGLNSSQFVYTWCLPVNLSRSSKTVIFMAHFFSMVHEISLILSRNRIRNTQSTSMNTTHVVDWKLDSLDETKGEIQVELKLNQSPVIKGNWILLCLYSKLYTCGFL